jgi:hypothetical protein
MVDMLLAVIPAALAGSAILAFFWTLVMRINDLESKSTATRMMQEAMQDSIQASIQTETRNGVEAVRSAMARRLTTLEENRQLDSSRMEALTRSLEDNAARQSRAVESMANMLGTLHSQIMEQEERLTAIVDLRLAKSAQETADELRRMELALAPVPQEAKSAAASA